MSDIRAVYGNRHAKPAATGGTMVRNLIETGSQTLPLHADAKISNSPNEIILHILQVSGPRRQRLLNYGVDAGKNLRHI
jgi:hypothetical protein